MEKTYKLATQAGENYRQAGILDQQEVYAFTIIKVNDQNISKSIIERKIEQRRIWL